MEQQQTIGVGLLGLGVVGGGVARVLLQNSEGIARQAGCTLHIRKILVRSLLKPRTVDVDPSLLTIDARQILADPEIDIVVELVGGEEPALQYIKEALCCHKQVVTANKEVIAKHGPELLTLAEEQGTGLFYEASVGGGIPLVTPLKQELVANRISALYAIINGTTNYILTSDPDVKGGDGIRHSSQSSAGTGLC